MSWLDDVVGTCPWCDSTITRVTPRGLDYEERLCCLTCLGQGAEGPCAICQKAITRRDPRDERGTGLVHRQCADREKRR